LARRQLGGGQRVELPGVVGTVGDQHHHLGRGLGAAQPVDAGPEAEPDRGAVRQGLELDLVEQVLDDVVVERQRAQGHRCAGEDDEPDAVVDALGDEAPDDVLGTPRRSLG
jgi:hypothetical protein